MKKYFYKVLSILLILSILLSQNFSSFAYTNNIRYNYFVNSSGQQISEYKIIQALQNSENIEFYNNNSYEKDKFTLNAINNKLNNNVYQYKINHGMRPTAIPAIYAVYTIVVFGVTYTLTIYNNGEILIKAGQKIIDTASAAGRAVMGAAKYLINSALEGIEIERIKWSIPSRLKKPNGDIDLGKFKKRVGSGNSSAFQEEETGDGWVIQKDRAGGNSHSSSWKLKTKKQWQKGRPNDRTATLNEDGKILRK